MYNRWFTTVPSEKNNLLTDQHLPKLKNKSGTIITIILSAIIIISLCLITYVIISADKTEKFTEFYVLDRNGQTTEYPRYLNARENASVILGLSNHEKKANNYQIQIWLINYSTSFNETENKNLTFVNHMWLLNNITIKLDSIPINTYKPWQPQWEYKYTFSLTREGEYKLAFLLFTTPTENYKSNVDYKESSEQILQNAYLQVYLWVTVTFNK